MKMCEYLYIICSQLLNNNNLNFYNQSSISIPLTFLLGVVLIKKLSQYLACMRPRAGYRWHLNPNHMFKASPSFGSHTGTKTIMERDGL